eukprot:5953112-Pyramimonas_sp.AAC.1
MAVIDNTTGERSRRGDSRGADRQARSVLQSGEASDARLRQSELLETLLFLQRYGHRGGNELMMHIMACVAARHCGQRHCAEHALTMRDRFTRQALSARSRAVTHTTEVCGADDLVLHAGNVSK